MSEITDLASKPKDFKLKGKYVVRTPTDQQRVRLEKLMENPDKPVAIPMSRQKKDLLAAVPTFVRNVMGSSAGAGSGEFHVYRHLRRKEFARQKQIQHKSRQEELDEEHELKMANNQNAAESKTAKKRAKRQKKKAMQRAKPRRAAGEANKEEEEEDDEDEDDNNNSDDGQKDEPDADAGSEDGPSAEKRQKSSDEVDAQPADDDEETSGEVATVAERPETDTDKITVDNDESNAETSSSDVVTVAEKPESADPTDEATNPEEEAAA